MLPYARRAHLRRSQQISPGVDLDKAGGPQQGGDHFLHQLSIGLLVNARKEIIFLHDFYRHDCTHYSLHVARHRSRASHELYRVWSAHYLATVWKTAFRSSSSTTGV